MLEWFFFVCLYEDVLGSNFIELCNCFIGKYILPMYSPWYITWAVFPFICDFFNFGHQGFIVFILSIFHFPG
jgi:hypothetical protein